VKLGLVASPLDDEGLFTGLWMARKCSVTETSPVRFIDEIDDPDRGDGPHHREPDKDQVVGAGGGWIAGKDLGTGSGLGFPFQELVRRRVEQ
jgi:hypothetical protein